jgi:predicted  nucleic acid-binding Zn-ribbon protein
MSATASLLALYRVDQQISGLSARLRQAENYLAEQQRLLAEIEKKRDAIGSQVRQLSATAHNDETESKGLESRIAALRERMNGAQTSKEHSAVLTEINTLKADKGLIEERALESMTKLDTLNAQQAEIETQHAERDKLRGVAVAERDRREAEIKDRLNELKGERTKALGGVPKHVLAEYQRMVDQGLEEIMAPVEEQSRRGMEYTCGSCYTHLPIEQVSILLKRGEMTKCPACKVILYMEEELHQQITTSQEKKSKKKVGAENG